MAQTWLVVGLGNPGPDYARTRHNIGQMALAEVERRAGATPKRHGRAEALVAESRIIGGPKVVTAFPTSWMNRSGGPVAKLMDWYGVEPDHVVVLHDELDLPLGTVRLKQGGGHGGHNGLRDIIARHGNSRDFHRLRIGIGHPGSADRVTPHVLSKPSAQDRDLIERAIDEAVRFTPDMLRGDLNGAMNGLNGFRA